MSEMLKTSDKVIETDVVPPDSNQNHYNRCLFPLNKRKLNLVDCINNIYIYTINIKVK